MNAARWQQVKLILNQALDVDSEERHRFVTEICADDFVLRHEVEDLLAFSERAEDLISDNGISGVVPLDVDSAYDPPTRAGPYRILREIGRGGMGVVCLAKRDDGEYERFVALKIIAGGVNGAKFAKFFLRERQILAQLDHPNIARLLDGGTTETGQPYYAMEFVDGEPLDKFCQPPSLALRDKLELFLSICSAVSHAHRNLIIHRDLKPKNVLVTPDGVPKLLDFGVARILADEAHLERTTATPLTPYYASPEQIRGEPLTVATDIYSLGVLLYEMLTGHLPYGHQEGPAAAIRAILEEDPIPPRQWANDVPADLENIIMMALRKEPERRYSTVDAFSKDLRDFLDGFPVFAAPDTFFYRFGKFSKRNRWAVMAATVALVAMSISAAMIWSEKRQAEMRFQQVRTLAHSVVFELDDAIQDLPGSSRARELLITRGLEYLNALANNRGHDPALTLELAQAYTKIGAAQGDLEQANAGDRDSALASYNKARDLLLDLRKQDPDNRDVKRSLALVDTDLAVLSPRSRAASTLAVEREAASLFQDLARTAVGLPGLRDRALAHFHLAFAEAEQGKFKEALPMWKQSLAEYQRLLDLDKTSVEAQRNVALVEKRLGSVSYALGDYASSIAYDRKAADIDEQRVAADPLNPTARMDLSFDLVELGWCLHETRDEKQAADTLNRAIALRRQLAATDPHDFRAQSEFETVLRMTGLARAQAGSPDEALTLDQQAAAVGAALHMRNPGNSDENINFALDCFELGDVYRAIALNDPARASETWRSALSSFEQAQQLASSIPASAFDDPNDRDKLGHLPEKIAECREHASTEQALR